MYDTDDITTEAEGEIVNFKQPDRWTLSGTTKFFGKKQFRVAVYMRNNN